MRIRLFLVTALAGLVAAGAAFAGNGPAKIHYAFVGKLTAVPSNGGVSITVEGGNRAALRAMLGQPVTQTFAYGADTVLKIDPDIDSSIGIGVGFLANDSTFFVENSQVEETISVGIAFFANKLIVFKIVKRVPLPSSLCVPQAFLESALREIFNQVDTTAPRRVFLPPDHFITLKVNDPAYLAVATQVLFLLDQPAIPIIAP